MNQELLLSAHSPALDRLEEAVRRGETVVLSGLQETQTAFVASRIFRDLGLRMLLVTANDLKANHAAQDLTQLLGQGVACLPGGELDLTRGASSQESTWRRLETLTLVEDGQVKLLTASMDALLQRMGRPEVFTESSLTLREGTVIPPDELLRRLVRMGYERMELVEGKGQCALRGSILDVYPPAARTGYRVEFFDDEVDSIRALDCVSQRSLQRQDAVRLTPATEVLLPEDRCREAAARMRRALQQVSRQQGGTSLLFEDLPPLPEDEEEDEAFFDSHVAPKAKSRSLTATREAELARRLSALTEDAETVAQGLPFRRIRSWLTVLTDDTATLLDWYRPQLVILSQPDHLRDRARERQIGFGEDLNNAIERGEAVKEQQSLLMTWDELLQPLQQYPLVACCDMLRGLGGIRPVHTLNLNSRGVQGYGGQLRPLAQDIRGWLDRGLTVALLSGGVARGNRLLTSLQEQELRPLMNEADTLLKEGGVTILPITLTHGFVWEEGGLAVVADTDIWGSGYRKAKSRRSVGQKISAFTELKPGEYVVHEHHGVAVFQGIVHMQNDGAWRDYLLLSYAGTDKLYVPVEQLQCIQRYIGNPNQPPKLNRIGGGDWQKQKAKVKEGLRKLAFDLVTLYASRSKETGYAFAPDTPWQQEFEDQFPYELTDDQANSVREIKQDMESARNMDRLLCGDVGYGKTEVSLRAAFKAVMDNKQVAILAPTTILAQQHYNTCVKRFAGFPVRIEVLSRFRTAKQVKALLNDLAVGKIDILVGTHRLLAKDVKFDRLGLLIVDEEQRFGVGHKELIKQLKRQVDVLTLSATPIPRTLHMSMVGIRDMSVLQTPPEDRLPVQTHVVEYADALVRDAILRELSRGGQVYFLYNRVHSIQQMYQRLRALVPEARIGVGHGQMREHGLEDVMMDFYAGSYDVLLCTTIIESGLDVPTANTMIVYDAERFGLSQLYQLRGRVGRSNRQAYAYFTVRSDKVLSETAQQRLQAIREFTEFGSGFRIAMRDLQIRGAGNLLGPEQHGHLETVGYEMYCRLIEQTLNEARGVDILPELQTRVDLKVDAFLPDNYIRSEGQRMELYRRIAALQTESDREDILDELVDRYGEPPQQVQVLLDVSELRYLASTMGVLLVQRRGDNLFLKLDEHYVKDPMLLVNAVRACPGEMAMAPGKDSGILLKGMPKGDTAALKQAVKLLRRFTGELKEASECPEA